METCFDNHLSPYWATSISFGEIEDNLLDIFEGFADVCLPARFYCLQKKDKTNENLFFLNIMNAFVFVMFHCWNYKERKRLSI